MNLKQKSKPYQVNSPNKIVGVVMLGTILKGEGGPDPFQRDGIICVQSLHFSIFFSGIKRHVLQKKQAAKAAKAAGADPSRCNST